MSFETISVIGLGYIGLPTAAMFAAYGKNVIGVDVNSNTVATINRGEIHIVEPELDAIVHKAVGEGKLKAVLSPEPADAFLIAVPTPFRGENHEPNLDFIEVAAIAVAKVLKRGDLVILESTSPVGATEKMADWLAEARPDLTFPLTHGEASDIRVAHCPERVLPGRVVKELVENDRVIGGLTPLCSNKASELYKIFVRGECVQTNSRTAEMAKLTENASRDVSIAFANELSIICDKLDIDVWELIELANRHPRVNILQPGPGVGGHCIAVDPWFIVATNPDESQLIRAARTVNDGKPLWVVGKVKIAIADFLSSNPEKTSRDVTVACFGLAFKPDIDDLRESPAVGIVESIGAFVKGQVFAVEPNIAELPPSMTENVSLTTAANALDLADIIVVLVDHKEFKSLNPVFTKNQMLIDTRGIWSKS
jgi:UDP-N-acetyl-D-mannosaminuronic acid dehydrogenase